MPRAAIGIGSNVGDAAANVRAPSTRLGEPERSSRARRSIAAQPWGVTAAGPVRQRGRDRSTRRSLRTRCSPRSSSIEAEAGRVADVPLGTARRSTSTS